MASKSVTFEQAEAKRQQAVDFLNRIGNTDAAEEFDGMSTAEYVEHRGLNIVNSNHNRRRNRYMANNNGDTKADLQEKLDLVEDILDGAYQVESSREALANAVAEALDILQGEEDEDLDEDEDLNGDWGCRAFPGGSRCFHHHSAEHGPLLAHDA